jgi:hypothetical protein
MIQIQIKAWVGNLVRFDYYNDGGRGLLDKPYRPKGKNAHFKLPNGKKKVEYFPNDYTDTEILNAVSKKYSNFKFTL